MKKAQSISESSPSQGNYNTFHGTNNPRWQRVLHALLSRSIPRKQLDSVAGCANAPDIVYNLRAQGLEIPCSRITVFDRDFRRCRVGVYHLTTSDRRKVSAWLKRREMNGAGYGT